MPASAPPAEVKRLYGVELDDFVPTRTAIAKALRGEGRRDEAAAVTELRKPSVAAWVVNRLARDEAGLVAELLDAGERLREVQLAAGSAEDLREAVQGEQDALRRAARAAEDIAAGRGSATDATVERVRETLHAAALDADLADEVRRGVLVREQQAVGFPMGVAVPPGRAPARRPAARKPPAKRTGPAPEPPAEDPAAAKRLERLAAAAEAARAELRSAEAKLADAEARLATAEAALARATRARDAAERKAEEAAERHRRAQPGT
jgi:chromosome segregation ATPase